MRTLIFATFLVGLAAARPETVSVQRGLSAEVDPDAVQNVLKIIPVLTDNIRSSDRSKAVQNIGAAVADIVRESAPESQRQQASDTADLTNAILTAVGDLVKDLPEIDIPEVKIPKIEIPKVVIPKIPEVKIPLIKIPEIPDFSRTDFSRPQEIIIPEIEIPEVEIPTFTPPQIPDIEIPEVKIPDFDIASQ